MLSVLLSFTMNALWELGLVRTAYAQPWKMSPGFLKYLLSKRMCLQEVWLAKPQDGTPQITQVCGSSPAIAPCCYLVHCSGICSFLPPPTPPQPSIPNTLSNSCSPAEAPSKVPQCLSFVLSHIKPICSHNFNYHLQKNSPFSAWPLSGFMFPSSAICSTFSKSTSNRFDPAGQISSVPSFSGTFFLSVT